MLRESAMKPLALTVLVVALATLEGCDPGMSIRQINSRDGSGNQSVVAAPEITMEVKTKHQLIGEYWYDPEIKATNSSDYPITITRVELVARGVTYENKPRGTDPFPLTLLKRSTASLDVTFRFSEGVHAIFKKPAELRIAYTSEGRDGLAHTTIVGGPLKER